MRVLIALWAVAAAVWLAVPADRAMAQTGPTTPVNIPDANLRALWETTLSKSPGATITRAEMAARSGTWYGDYANWNTVADPPSPPATVIRDLTGMEYATGLTTMYSAFHRISDVSPLAGLTGLTRLSLSRNVITDVSPLAGLTNLRVLSIAHNQVSDLSPLSGLTGLTTLNVDYNQVSDLRPLARLTALSILDLHNNQISDLGPLAGLTGLQDLSLHGNRISDLGPLTGLTGLRDLSLAGNRISDLTPLQGKNLRLLNLDYNEGVTDLSVVRDMTNLQTLRLDGTGVVDLAPLVANTELGSGDRVYLREVPNLNANAETDVATLRGRGVLVYTNTPLRLDTMVRGVQVTPGVESLMITWNRLATASGFTPTGYRLQWKGEGDHAFLTRANPPRHHNVVGLATTIYTIPGLTPGEEYQVRVRAHGVYGTPSAVVTCIPLASASDPVTCERRTASGGGAPVRDSVTDLEVRAAAESLVLSWRADSAADAYRVQWRASGAEEMDPADQACLYVREGACDGAETGSAVPAGAGRTVSYTIAGLEPGTEYRVYVTPLRGNEPLGDPTYGIGTPYRTTLVTIAAAEGAAEVVEGGAAKLRVRLNQPARTEVTVAWSTADGTAAAGEDYRARDERLTFEPGEQEQAVTVATLQDRRVEAAESFLVRLTRAENAELEGASATVTIIDDDAEAARGTALSMVLAGLGRWTAADAVEVIGDRLRGRQAVEAQVSVGGQPLALAGGAAPAAAWSAAPAAAARYVGGGRLEPWMAAPAADSDAFPPDAAAAELISGSRFNLPLSRLADAAGAGADADDGARLRVWVQGAGGGFAGRPTADFRTDGTVLGGYFGIDAGWGQDTLVGLAMAHSRSGVDYTLESITSGKANLILTSALPYAHWRPRAGLEVWGLAGVGLGGAALQDEAGTVETDLVMWLAAGGVRQQVATVPEVEVDVAVEADAFLTELRASGTAGLPPAAGSAGRLRLRLAGRRQWEVSPVSRMTPRLEVGGRYDGGSDGDGLGVEVGGGLGYAHRGLGLEMEAQGRVLVAHSKQAFGEWGGGLRVTWLPGESGQGPWLTFAPGWGREASQVEQIWDSKEEVFRAPDRGGEAEALDLAPNRLALETGWGVAAPGGAGVVTPYAGLTLAGSELSGYRLGARLAAGSGTSLGLEGRGGSQREYEVMLYGRLDW